MNYCGVSSKSFSTMSSTLIIIRIESRSESYLPGFRRGLGVTRFATSSMSPVIVGLPSAISKSASCLPTLGYCPIYFFTRSCFEAAVVDFLAFGIPRATYEAYCAFVLFVA